MPDDGDKDDRCDALIEKDQASDQDASRFREALLRIVELLETPDTNVVGTEANGKVGQLWSTEGKDRAFDQVLAVKRALEEDSGA